MLNLVTKTLLLCIALTSCRSYVSISESMQKQIQDTLAGKEYWLKQSMYGGPFYDDDRLRLLHVRPFKELTYLTTLDGDVILPPPSDEIVPVGTRVTVQKIEWPTKMNILKRPIFTPRFWPWVYLQVARDRGSVTLNRDKPYILLLPSEVTDESTLHQWMNETLSIDDTNKWLWSFSDAVREGILNKRPVIGMSHEALYAAMGQPDQIQREWVTHDEKRVTKEVALYGPLIVILEDGKVVAVE